jgi:HEAT repeat protein
MFPPCVTYFEATIDMLWSIVSVAMTLAASLLYQPSGYENALRLALLAQGKPLAGPSVVFASFQRAPDVGDLVTRLRSGDPRDRVAAACQLQQLGSDARSAIPALVAQLPDGSPVDPMACGKDRYFWSKDTEREVTPGEEAAAALVAIGTESLPSLVTASGAPQWVARRNAVWALGALDDSRGAAPVLAALGDREPPVRRVAAWALGALQASDAVPALIAALKDSDADVRSQVAWALGAIGDRRAVDGLIDALKDAAEHVRSQAAWALGSIGDPRASDALAAALKDASPRVRKQAAWALGAFGRRR